MVSAPPCHGGLCGFESRRYRVRYGEGVGVDDLNPTMVDE